MSCRCSFHPSILLYFYIGAIFFYHVKHCEEKIIDRENYYYFTNARMIERKTHCDFSTRVQYCVIDLRLIILLTYLIAFEF